MLRLIARTDSVIMTAMIRPFLVGFATTFKHMFRKPITVNYPDEKVPMFPKYRGKQVLMRDENGLEKCVACGLCAVACPADAIYLEAAENDGSVQAGPRYASLYQIHKTRCIFCGYCEEACPVSAIFMGKDYELAVYDKKDFIWDKQDLLVPASTRPARRARVGRSRQRGAPRGHSHARDLVCSNATGFREARPRCSARCLHEEPHGRFAGTLPVPVPRAATWRADGDGRAAPTSMVDPLACVGRTRARHRRAHDGHRRRLGRGHPVPGGRHRARVRGQIQRRWPHVECVCASAERLDVLATERDMFPLDHIVSGLPFVSCPGR